MLRALLWKEWREQRAVVFAGLLLVAIAPPAMAAWSAARPNPLTPDDYLQLLWALFVLFLWPLFAAACGAGTVAPEHARGSLGFLLSRPMPRWLVVAGKAFSALVAWGLIVAGSIGVMSLVASVTGGSVVPRGDAGLVDPEAEGLTALAATGSLLVLACALLLSTVMRRTLAVAASAIVLALTVLAGAAIYVVRLDPMIVADADDLGVWIAGFAAVVAVAAGVLFCTGGLLRGREGRRRAFVAAAVALAAIASGTALAGWWSIRFDLDEAILVGAEVVPDGSGVVMQMTNARGRSSQIWMLPADGADPYALTPRASYAFPQVPVDGRMVFFNMLTASGFHDTRPRIGTVGLDGEDLRWAETDRRLDHMFARPRAVAPDGKRMILGNVAAFELDVLDFESAEITRHRLDDLGFRWAAPVGWTADSRSVLLLTSLRVERVDGKLENRGKSLIAYDLDARAVSLKVDTYADEAISGNLLGTGLGADGLVRGRVPLVLMDTLEPAPRGDGLPPAPWERKRMRLVLIDAADGSIETLMDSWCGGHFAVDDAQRSIAFVECVRDGDRAGRQLVVHDLGSGTRSVYARLPDAPAAIRFEPGTDRVLVRQQDHAPELIAPDGGRHAVGGRPDLYPIGWLGAGRLVYSRHLGDGRLELLAWNGRSGELERLFPPESR